MVGSRRECSLPRPLRQARTEEAGGLLRSRRVFMLLRKHETEGGRFRRPRFGFRTHPAHSNSIGNHATFVRAEFQTRWRMARSQDIPPSGSYERTPVILSIFSSPRATLTTTCWSSRTLWNVEGGHIRLRANGSFVSVRAQASSNYFCSKCVLRRRSRNVGPCSPR